jgi:hypothetical protein
MLSLGKRLRQLLKQRGSITYGSLKIKSVDNLLVTILNLFKVLWSLALMTVLQPLYFLANF